MYLDLTPDQVALRDQLRTYFAAMMTEELQQEIKGADARLVQRQALAGMIWSKQTYTYDVREWLNGQAYSIADIATFPWAARHEWQRIDLNDYPNVKRWYLTIAARPAVQKGFPVPGGTSTIPMPK